MYRILVVFFILSSTSYGQVTKFSLKSGLRLRVTPIYTSGYSPIIINPDPPVLIQQDPHLSGLSVFTGINYKLSNSVNLFYLIFVRYDQFYTDQTTLKKQFFLDHSIGLNKAVLQKKNTQVTAGLSLTFANRNSEFSYRRQFTDAAGNISYSLNTSDFNFTTIDLPIEYNRKSFFAGLTTSFSIKEKFAESSPFLLLSLHAGYKFPIRKKIKSQ
ncbi:MAG: hypothetical protein K2X48_02385 [Chitinophagaceae bacterium]|nr:hypothetical protein [Chitinophagaceae bacterium]